MYEYLWEVIGAEFSRGERKVVVTKVGSGWERWEKKENTKRLREDERKEERWWWTVAVVVRHRKSRRGKETRRWEKAENESLDFLLVCENGPLTLTCGFIPNLLTLYTLYTLYFRTLPSRPTLSLSLVIEFSFRFFSSVPFFSSFLLSLTHCCQSPSLCLLRLPSACRPVSASARVSRDSRSGQAHEDSRLWEPNIFIDTHRHRLTFSHSYETKNNPFVTWHMRYKKRENPLTKMPPQSPAFPNHSTAWEEKGQCPVTRLHTDTAKWE